MNTFDFAGTQFDLVRNEGIISANPSSMMTVPAALVGGLSSASYQFPDEKQAILDALSPFQLISKYWSTMAMNHLLDIAPDTEKIVYVGSWFGQQSALAQRICREYNNYAVYLVDKDPVASRVAQYLIKHDAYHRRSEPTVWMKDIFMLSNEFPANTVFVWNGLEHFDSNDVEMFLEHNTESSFIFQSTSMQANDHVNLAGDVDDILDVLPTGWDEGILYKGELQCDLGSRYMMVVRGPGCDPIVEYDDSDEDNEKVENSRGQ